jgi:hypothetical protein
MAWLNASGDRKSPVKMSTRVSNWLADFRSKPDKTIRVSAEHVLNTPQRALKAKGKLVMTSPVNATSPGNDGETIFKGGTVRRLQPPPHPPSPTPAP